MRALVLSGGGNYGAMQAGALEVLIESGLAFEMVVGNSAGALNAISLAADPTPSGVDQLKDVWRRVGASEVGSLSVPLGLRQLVLQQEGLFPSYRLARFLLGNFPGGVVTFGDLHRKHGIRAYTQAVELSTGEPRLFGDRDDDRLLDGAMASSALPPYFAPWRVDGRRYLDGGIHTNLPIRAAIERGADEVIALWLRPRLAEPDSIHGMIGITTTAFSLMVRSLSDVELAWARDSGVPVRLLGLDPPQDIHFWDFEHTDRLIESGRRAARRALREQPLDEPWWPKLRRRARRWLGFESS